MKTELTELWYLMPDGSLVGEHMLEEMFDNMRDQLLKDILETEEIITFDERSIG